MTTPTLPTTVHTTARRRFLTWSGVTAGALVAGGAATLSWPQLFAAAQRTPLDPQAGVLVVVTLYGGNDGLNTVVPAADPAYAAARPDLAYRPDEVLDVGTGANLVYPLIGHAEYGWRFVGSDIERGALASAQAIIDANEGLADAIELRLQPSPARILHGIVRREERFDLVMCNPPFHASMEDARAGSTRKWKNLGRASGSARTPLLNFGGRSAELVCAGGEAGFVRRMIEESALMPERCRWFTSLVAKAENLRAIESALNTAGVRARRTIEMAQGQKKSRIVAWTYLSLREQQAWRSGARGG